MVSSQKIEKLHVLVIKALIFFLPLLPLYVSSSMIFPFITGKNFAFRILVEFAAALWISLMIMNTGYRLRSSPLVVSILFFTFIAGLADILGIDPYKSFWSNYERMEGYITILHLAVYFMIVKSVLRTRRDWMIYFNIFFGTSFLVSLSAFIYSPELFKFTQFGVVYEQRLYGTIGNPPFLASYLLLSTFLGLILIFNTGRPYLKYTYFVLALFNITVIYLTASRGAILAAAAGAVLVSFFFLLGRKDTPREKLFRKLALLFLVFLLLVSALILAFDETDFIQQNRILSRFSAIFSDPSAISRINVWKMAWNGFKERPILGWGQENFIGIYTVNPIPFKGGDQKWMDRAHNIVIEWLINAGIVGLLAYLAISGSAFFVIWKSSHEKLISKSEKIISVTALAVYLIHNLFTFDTINTYLVFFTLLAFMDSIDSMKGAQHEVIQIESKKLKIQSVGASFLALLAVVSIGYFINYKPVMKAQLLKQLTYVSPERYKSFTALLDDFKRALSYETFDDNHVRLKMANVSGRIMLSEFFPIKGASELIQETIIELENGTASNRQNLEYLTRVIKFYNFIASYDPSFAAITESFIKKSIRINPEYEGLYFELARNYSLNKDYEKAYMIVSDMAGSDKENDAKQFELALAAIYTSRGNVASNAFEHVKKIRSSNNRNVAEGKETVFSHSELYFIAKAYLAIQNYERALQYYQDAINLMPDKARYHFEIAEIYTTVNDKDNAIREAKKAAEIAPMQYKAKAKRLIDMLNN